MPQTFLVPVAPRGLARPRRWRVALLVGLTLSLSVVTRGQAATTWTVCASGCNSSSIKAAIAALTTVDGETLAIGAGTYTEPGITVNKSLILQGEDAATTIVQAATTPGIAPDRVFLIPRGITVTLQELTIRHGSTLEGGAGIYNNAGTLTLINSTVRGNVAKQGGGGGLFNAGKLTLTNSTVSGNSAEYGGVYTRLGRLWPQAAGWMRRRRGEWRAGGQGPAAALSRGQGEAGGGCGTLPSLPEACRLPHQRQKAPRLPWVSLPSPSKSW
jgi:hypothetical protein